MTTSEIDRDIYRKVRDGELEEKATCREFRQVRTEGKREVARRITHDAENGKGI